jgi:D-sedoheptulose 7-phosphate isomerase
LRHILREQLGKTIAVLEKVCADDALLDVVSATAVAAAEAMRRGGKLMIAGNGGSAADAQHLVSELVVRLARNRPALRDRTHGRHVDPDRGQQGLWLRAVL